MSNDRAREALRSAATAICDLYDALYIVEEELAHGDPNFEILTEEALEVVSPYLVGTDTLADSDVDEILQSLSEATE